MIVSGNATDAVTAQAILDRARGLAGPYLASNGELIDRINSMNNSQIDIKVYVLEVDKTAQVESRHLALRSRTFAGRSDGTDSRFRRCSRSSKRLRRSARVSAFTIQPFYRTTTLAPTLNLLMQDGTREDSLESRLGDEPRQQGDLPRRRRDPGGHLDRTRRGQRSVSALRRAAQRNARAFSVTAPSTPSIAPEISALDYANAVVVSGFTIPALTVSQLSTDVITRPGESIILGGLVQSARDEDDLEDPAALRRFRSSVSSLPPPLSELSRATSSS